MNLESKEKPASATLAGCFSLALLMAPLGLLGLWVGAKIGSYVSPEDELVLGYIMTDQELFGGLLGGAVGLLLGYAVFSWGKRLLAS
jgi:xanthosine utilization system XapX-like protein